MYPQNAAAPETQLSADRMAEQIAVLMARTHFSCPVALLLEHSSQTEGK